MYIKKSFSSLTRQKFIWSDIHSRTAHAKRFWNLQFQRPWPRDLELNRKLFSQVPARFRLKLFWIFVEFTVFSSIVWIDDFLGWFRKHTLKYLQQIVPHFSRRSKKNFSNLSQLFLCRSLNQIYAWKSLCNHSGAGEGRRENWCM